MRKSFGMGVVIALAGCVGQPEAVVAPPEVVVADPLDVVAPPVDARRVDEFDTTTEAQRVAALDTAQDGVFLGEAVLSLGDPGRAGFWVETSLVSINGQGRVALNDGDREVDVELLAGTGSGRISLAALRLLEVDLTSLVEVNIYEYQ